MTDKTCSKSLDEAREIFLGSCDQRPVKTEVIHINYTLNRVLSKSIKTPEDSPPFSRALIEGYALISQDTLNASEDTPVSLKIAGKVKMGIEPSESIVHGMTMYIPTGGMLPHGSDTVAKIDYCREKKDEGYIDIFLPVSEKENIASKGCEFKKDAEIIPAFTLIRPSHIGLLAEFNILEVEVVQKPRVAILSTGDEIVDTTSKLKPGQIRDSNSFTMSAMVEEAGGIPLKLGVINDDFETLRKVIADAIDKEDMALITGGTAVDGREFIAEVFNSIGKPGVLINGVAMKSGRPVILANVGGKPLIGLPGYPPGAIYCFDLFVKPALELLRTIR